MRLLLKFYLAELAISGGVLLGLSFSPWWEKAALGGVGVAFVIGCLILGLKAWVMQSKRSKLIKRALLAILLSLAVRAFALAVGLLWAVTTMDAPGAFLLGFLSVYAMQLVLENGYLLLEQKRQSSLSRENE